MFRLVVLGIFVTSGTLVFGQDGKQRETPNYNSLGDTIKTFNDKYGEEALAVFQKESIEKQIPLYIMELSTRNKTEAEEANRIYFNFQNQLKVDKEANSAWSIVARNQARNMGEVINAAYILDSRLGMKVGELNNSTGTGMIIRRKRGIFRWLKRNWPGIVAVVSGILSYFPWG